MNYFDGISHVNVGAPGNSEFVLFLFLAVWAGSGHAPYAVAAPRHESRSCYSNSLDREGVVGG